MSVYRHQCVGHAQRRDTGYGSRRMPRPPKRRCMDIVKEEVELVCVREEDADELWPCSSFQLNQGSECHSYNEEYDGMLLAAGVGLKLLPAAKPIFIQLIVPQRSPA